MAQNIGLTRKKMAKAAFAGVLLSASCMANAASVVLTSVGGGLSGWVDNGSGDVSSLLGIMQIDASVADWNVALVTGVTKPILGSAETINMDLNSLTISSSGSSDDFAVLFGDFDFTGAGTVAFNTSIGGTVQNADISWQVCQGPASAITCAISPGAFIGPGDSSTASFSEDSSFSIGVSGSYFMGLAAVITPHASAPVVVSFDYQITQVPIPAAAWLFGSALLGMVAVKRKKA